MSRDSSHAPPSSPPPGRFGRDAAFGGAYVPETLNGPVRELAEAYDAARRDPDFTELLARELRDFAGRPTPLLAAPRLAAEAGIRRLYLKREDLLHTGAHKINNAIGQALLARRIGKTRLIAETGAGQHGVATATVAARYGLACVVYMGAIDMERQRPNVERMRLLGAEVVAVDSGSRTLKDAINEAMRDWSGSVRTTHYLLGSVLGPHPYPTMVGDFHAAIGREAREQIQEAEGALPDSVVACVGGGSNAIGIFRAFLGDAAVSLVGVEAAGEGIASGRHAARFAAPAPGVLHGTRTLVLQDAAGQVLETHSISAGLDYPAVGPEHAALGASGRARYEWATDDEAVGAFLALGRLEGILPALESSHALAWVLREGKRGSLGKDPLVVVNLSGRGDKDLAVVEAWSKSRTAKSAS
ncbi:MAG TPA: tryptophan synthase subunit beta [Candidatus Eisenbacteria bacterium]|nr:tryptophan synthase subunit beta [Candidatus Eisenbacteria bacterium]